MTRNQPGRAGRWRVRAVWLTVWAVAGAGLFWAASGIAWSEVRAALRGASLSWILLATLLNFCGLPFWALAFRQFIPSGEPRSLPRIAGVLALTMAAIQSLSVFAGGAMAAWLLVRRAGMSTGAMISVITLEQVSTGVAKSVIVGVAVLATPAPAVLRAAGATLLTAVGLGLAALVWAAHSGEALRGIAARAGGGPGRMIAHFAEWTSHLETLRRPARFAAGIGFTLVRRSMEVLAAMCIQQATGIPVSPGAALLVIAALAIATIIPGPPGNLGIYEAAVVAAYSWSGTGAEIAVAAALLQHVAYLIASLVPGYGLFAWWRIRGEPIALR